MTKVDECCVWVPGKESPVKEIDVVCDDVCKDGPSNGCGLTAPEGSGTLAGCESTVLPHFGVVMNKRAGKCKQFGYYTSGNTKEYESECGNIDALAHTTKTRACGKDVTYTVTDTSSDAAQTAGVKANKAAAAKNAADIKAKHP